MDRLDPELVAPLAGFMEAMGGDFDLSDLPTFRAGLAGMLAGVNAEAPPTPGIVIEDSSAPSHETGVEVPIRMYRPERAGARAPVLLWTHPGGFVIGSPAMDELMARQLAADLGIVVVSVDYRLAPEHPHPAALEDCYGVLEWIAEQAEARGFALERLAIGGASAGANLAASLCLLTRDRKGPKPSFQWLFYPALDDRNIELASESVADNPFWSRENTRKGWQAYLGGKAGQAGVPAYAAPIRATDLSGLPRTFIGVGTADMLLEENLSYAERLAAAGTEVELRVYPGACHAFDSFAPASRVAQAFVADRNAALARALA
jgi:acetyl esterase/lipase